MIDVNGYLARLGVEHPGPPSAEALRQLHAAHVERVAYEVLDIHLDRVVPIDAESSVSQILRGRGGYCYTLNGAFSALLTALGYQVTWHRAGVQATGEEHAPGAGRANHMTLIVTGLPDQDWMADVGMGDALHEPLPLAEGTYEQGPFRYRLRPSEVVPGGWRLDHDPAGSFTGMDFESRTAEVSEFQARHEYMCTSPDSEFVRTCVVRRRDASGIDSLLGCVLRRTGTGSFNRVLDNSADWYGALADVFGLTPADLGPDDRDRLWRRVHSAHEAWMASGGFLQLLRQRPRRSRQPQQ
ncbi:arylamine N-acetyltransferase [Streptomyces sp. NPDC050508]|uniref:arylamine N-acetyltransferase family protein n=1 Tax=Streptomyces sp. NPDC050508 TaxID=3155405 RepID=UPI00343B80E5